MQKSYRLFILTAISAACSSIGFAATPVNLSQEPLAILKARTAMVSLTEVSKHVDLNHTTHIRIQQMYDGHPVWGADAVVHIARHDQAGLADVNKNTTANGTIYNNLQQDLQGVARFALAPQQADKALDHAMQLHQKKTGFSKHDRSKSKSTLIVYVDKDNKAHWAYHVTFLSGFVNGTPAVPTYILDAQTFAVYAEWNDLQSVQDTASGGYGGNVKMGKLSYDGSQGNYPTLKISRDNAKNLCELTNADVEVKDDTDSDGPFSNSPTASFDCAAKDADHGNLYWNGDADAINGGYSPVNDSLYIGTVIKDMYLNWYKVPVLSALGTPLKLYMHAHAKDMQGKTMDNAFFLGLTLQMYFGDGVKMFYPLTSLGVGAHELSHGFTSQHSKLVYAKQSGGLNEAYSDMAAQAAEFYSTGTNSWQIGPEIVKGKGALRYMDDPTKDGKSIGHVKNYTDTMNVHYTSGVFNKAFYLIGTSKDWDTHKAFDIMVKANMDYWTANTTFKDAACGVVHATKDYHYPVADVKNAFKEVGIDTSSCQITTDIHQAVSGLVNTV